MMKNTYPEELCKLALENTELIEDSLTVIETIEADIITNIDNYVKKFVLDKKLKADNDVYSEGGFWKTNWKNDNDTWKAWFYLEETKNGNSDWFISSLLGCRGAKIAIKFYLEPKTFGISTKQIQSKLPLLYNENEELKERGFYINQKNKNTIDIDFTITTEEALKSYLGEEQSFKELDNALEHIYSSLDVFDTVIKKIDK